MKLNQIIKTKTFWSGIALLVYGLLAKDPQSVMTGVSVIFLRDAMIKKEDDDAEK